MVHQKFSDSVISEVSTILNLNYSLRAIQKKFKEKGTKISIGYLSDIKNGKYRPNKRASNVTKPGPKRFISEHENVDLLR